MTPEPNSDKSLDSEIEAALDGINLQEIDQPSGPQQGGRGGGRGRGAAGGERLYEGIVQGVSGDDVIVELGPRMQGVCSIREFDEAPSEGDKFKFTLHGRDEDDLWMLSRREAKALAAWNDLEVGAHVKATVQSVNKGGLGLKIGSNDAFMPASQASYERIEDLSVLVGQTLVCEVLEIDPNRRRVVLSHRKVVEAERRLAMEEQVGKLHSGLVMTGKVTRIESFGAFVDLGGVEGLVHVSNMSRQRVENTSEFLTKGQEVKVMIMEIKDGGRRVGLSMKALEPDPWDQAEERLRDDMIVTGKVTRLMDFGAFVDVGEGLEGLLHVSQLGRDRVRRPGDVVKVGEEVSVRVISCDPAAQRIALSRLDPRGALLGSEEAVDAKDIDEMLQSNRVGDKGLGTSFGDLFKKAMDKKKP